MANLEWRQVQGVPGNPVDGFRTFMEGMRGAEAAARGIRDNEIKNHEVGMQNLDQIRKGITGIRKQDLEELKLTAAGPELFNRQELGSAVTEHYFSGGNIDNFQFPGFNPADEDQYTFAKGVFKEREDRMSAAMGVAREQLEAGRLAAINRAKGLGQEGTEEYELEVRRINQEFDEQEQNLRATVFEQELGFYNNQGSALGLNRSTPNASQVSDSAVSVLENRATGQTPRQAPQRATGAPSHAQSRLAEKNDERNRQAAIRDESIAAIKEAHEAGDMDTEEAQMHIDIADEQYIAVMRDYNNEWNKSVMTGADGAVYGTDFLYNEDGSITVGGQTLSPEVSNAVQEAAETSGIPVDMLLGMFRAESGYNPKATSKTGAGGLGQLTKGAIEDVIRDYPDELEAAGIPLSTDMDRHDPRTNAIVSALYMKLQHEKYLGGKGSIEDRYIAYNIGAENSFVNNERFAKANPDIPIDRFDFPVTSDAVKKNINVYRKPNGQWRTKNEVYAEIRRRMGITKASPDDVDPTRTIEHRAANARNTGAGNTGTPSQLTTGEQSQSETPGNSAISKNYQQLRNFDPLVQSEAFANSAGWIADSVPQNPGIMGGDNVANLDKTFYEEALSKAGISADNKIISLVHDAFNTDPELRRLNSDAVTMLISWAPDGMWRSNLDKAGLQSNIKIMLENQENSRREYLQFVDDAKALKKSSEEIRTMSEDFDTKVAGSRDRLARYNQDINTTDDPNDKATLIRLRDNLNDQMGKEWELHKNKLQRLTTEALESAENIETMNQHLKQEFSKGISYQAEEDIKNAKNGNRYMKNAVPLTPTSSENGFVRFFGRMGY